MSSDVTDLLQRWRQGDTSALNDLMPLVYSELHRVAAAFLRDRRSNQTLQPTALISEAYLKLLKQDQPQFADRAHFMAVMSRVMRQVLIDYARAAGAVKRGGQNERVPWDTAIQLEAQWAPRQLPMLDVDRALTELENDNPSLARVLEAHYFGGMTAEEISTVEGRSAHAIRHDIRLGRAWLRRELDQKA